MTFLALLAFCFGGVVAVVGPPMAVYSLAALWFRPKAVPNADILAELDRDYPAALALPGRQRELVEARAQIREVPRVVEIERPQGFVIKVRPQEIRLRTCPYGNR